MHRKVFCAVYAFYRHRIHQKDVKVSHVKSMLVCSYICIKFLISSSMLDEIAQIIKTLLRQGNGLYEWTIFVINTVSYTRLMRHRT